MFSCHYTVMFSDPQVISLRGEWSAEVRGCLGMKSGKARSERVPLWRKSQFSSENFSRGNFCFRIICLLERITYPLTSSIFIVVICALSDNLYSRDVDRLTDIILYYKMYISYPFYNGLNFNLSSSVLIRINSRDKINKHISKFDISFRTYHIIYVHMFH